MAERSETQDCPYCKEEIKSDAVKCKHCGSMIAETKPSHEGTCPYCKESINQEAVKCKHCKSMFGSTDLLAQGVPDSGCGCGVGVIEKQISTSPVGDQGQQLAFGGFSIKCFYLGPFLGRWCCLYFNGKWITCTDMRQRNEIGNVD